MPEEQLNILLVEDDDEDAEIFRRYVRRMPSCRARVHRAVTTAEGLERLSRESFDVLFVDLRLAGSINGLELLEKAREMFPQVPPIMVTGTGDETKAVDAMKAGAYDYLVKDQLTSWGLERAIRNTLEKFRLEQERELLMERLQKLTLTDELTGLANRRRLERNIRREIRRSNRSKKTFCVLMIDLDRFKRVNDRYGHQKGDEILQSFAHVLESVLRSTDVAARYGGEEFCVLTIETGIDGALMAAEKIREAAEAQPSPAPTVSIGVAAWEPSLSADELIGRADEALYAAKENGRNQTLAWPPDRTGDRSEFRKVRSKQSTRTARACGG
jgi:diguanylate cyclase (GGDEF)-like protein